MQTGSYKIYSPELIEWLKENFPIYIYPYFYRHVCYKTKNAMDAQIGYVKFQGVFSYIANPIQYVLWYILDTPEQYLY